MNKKYLSIKKCMRQNCSKFTGYKPCAPYKVCEDCTNPFPIRKRILLIALEAQGAVVMATSLLHAIKQKHHGCYLFWLTREEARPLLENNHLIDEVLSWNDENRIFLSQIKFDIIYSLDKSRYTSAFVNSLTAKKKFGFGLSSQGTIIPLNRGAHYNYILGLNDTLKFHENRLTGVEILHKTVQLPYRRQGYNLFLRQDEKEYRNKWAKEAGLSQDDIVIGFNTGCSRLFPNKKLSVEQHVKLIEMLYSYNSNAKIILLGGREDSERNLQIHKLCGNRPINTPSTEGLRRGIIYIDLADIIVSGDSLGMHIAIALNKYVIAWFGLSCAQEIDLFNRGEKIISEVMCAPCWKKSCDDLKCRDEISLQKIYKSIIKGVKLLRSEKAGQKILSFSGSNKKPKARNEKNRKEEY